MTTSIQSHIEEIRKARLEKGWSQQELAKKSGLTQSHVSRVEQGKIDLRFSNLIELSRVLDLELMLVPRRAVPAVNALIQQLNGNTHSDLKQAYSLDDDEDGQ